MTPPAAAAAPAVRPRRSPAPTRPRRVSGPVRRTSGSPARPRANGRQTGLIFGLIASLEGLAQHRLIDRLIRGRIWIGLVAFALLGIVTLQLGLLRLNGGIGRALEHQAMLQRENATLSIENSEMAASERILSRATRLGMATVPSGELQFLTGHSVGDATKAAAALSSAARAGAESSEAASTASATGESSEAASGESSESSEAEASSEAAATSSPSEGESSESEASSSGGEAGATSESSQASGEASAAGGAAASSQGE